MQKRHANREMYFEESAKTCGNYYIPYIEGRKPVTSPMSIMEIGCGEGGNLMPFALRGCKVTGIDVAEGRIGQARHFFSERGLAGSFIHTDFMDMAVPENNDEKFDVILLHDVIEHVHDKQGFLAHATGFMKPGGVLFVAFPAWQMPFGGHQQICRSRVWSRMPFLHLLPSGVYLFVLRHVAHESQGIIDELHGIRHCKTSIELFEHTVGQLDLKIASRVLWLINPHYQQKFGLRPRRLSRAISRIPYVRNFFSTSCFYILTLPESH